MTSREVHDEFDAGAIIASLNRHGVHYVVIGALAAQLQGAPIPRTRDVDITPATDTDNLQRLSNALHELNAKIRTADVPEGLVFGHDAASLSRARFWNLTTPFGEFDVSFIPTGTEGYDDLARHAHMIESYGQSIPVADLDDVIRSKEAAGRPKDILQLPILLQTSQRLNRQREQGQDIDRDSGPGDRLLETSS